MLYRLLGVLTVAIGTLFAFVTIMVVLPFLNNFNVSLLALAAIFAVLAWVFLAIGWQLMHPPAPRSAGGMPVQEGRADTLSAGNEQPDRPDGPARERDE